MFGSPQGAAAELQERSSYSLTFGDLDDRSVAVAARLRVDGSTLHTDAFPIWFDDETTSWWEHIQVHRLVAEDGEPLTVRGYRGSRANLSRPVTGWVEIHYSVDISFIDRPLSSSNAPAGASFGDGLFVVGKALFVFGCAATGAEVHVAVPAELTFHTPWAVDGNGYVVPTLRQLTWTNLALSSGPRFLITEGGLNYEVVTLGLSKSASVSIRRFGADMVRHYSGSFPLRQPARYLQIAFRTGGPGWSGEAYLDSSASALIEERMEELHWAWQAVLGHELFHRWNSHSLNLPNPGQLEWFVEGVTEFITYQAMLRVGTISSTRLLAREGDAYEKLLGAFASRSSALSISRAGQDKALNYDLVYKGGWIVGAWLDVALRRATRDEWDLRALLGRLLIRYPEDGDRPFTLGALFEEVRGIDTQVGDRLEDVVTSSDWARIQRVLHDPEWSSGAAPLPVGLRPSAGW